MPTKPKQTANALPPAWLLKNGTTIVEAAVREAKRRRLRVDRLVSLIKRDPIKHNQVEIHKQLCEVLPGVILEADEKYGDERFARLHPALEDSSSFLIYVIQDWPVLDQLSFFVLPANEKTKAGAWSVSLKSLLPNKDAWHLLKMIGGKLLD